jgi:DNA-binding protein HU-beta
MNIAELADHIAGQHGMDKKQAKTVVEAVFAAVVETAVKGEEVSLPGFGKFKVASRDARQGRNPATGEAIQIAASKKLAFTPAKQVKDALNVAKKAPAPAAKTAPKARAKKAG